MYIKKVQPRAGWRRQVEELGYLADVVDNPPYWVEALQEPFYAVFALGEIEDAVEIATSELYSLCLALVDRVCVSDESEELFNRLKIPTIFREAIKKSWSRQDRSLYGRFDFAYNEGVLKMLEFNGDTPTSLYEASVLQWRWFEDLKRSGSLPKSADQFNSIHERLIEGFAEIGCRGNLMHFLSIEDAEDEQTVRYIQSVATLAGIRTKFIYIHDLGWDEDGHLVDLDNAIISDLFKLYPWEFLFREDEEMHKVSGRSIFADLVNSAGTSFLEPIWKSILSNKGILPLLWEMDPKNPYLLRAEIDQFPAAQLLRNTAHVRKPLLGREGGGVTIKTPFEEITRDSAYGAEGFILQEYTELPSEDGFYLVLGSWVVNGKAAGMGIRADRSKITGNGAHFIPHVIID